MDLDTLRLLVNVARRGSFAAVARDHAIEPSTISRLVAAAETELGFRLFQRTTRQLAATDSGTIYLARVERLIEDLDAARDEAIATTSGPSGPLRLTASVAFGSTRLIPLIPSFRRAYPNVELELVLTDTNLHLVEERIDLAVRLAPEVRADVVCSKLMATRYRVVATPDYLRRAPVLAEPADVTAHDCLLFTLADFRTRWLFRAIGSEEENEVRVRGPIVISNAMALYTAVLGGLGPALLPDWLIGADVEAGRLIDIFPDHDVAATSFDTAAWLLYPSRSFLPNKVRVMIDFLRSRIGRNGN